MSFKAFSRDSDNNILLPTKSKRSQSALEYMMTYGWAILIIVIVAVILYSMGIFNPSSSVTFTSSGFSPFTVSSSLCNNLGYKIAVLAGPIPNNANSLQIDRVYLTSATGANATTAAYTLKNPVTLKSGQSATILIPNVACNAANVHYSISANIQYSYTASTLGLQTVNTTGTVAGTSISGKPSVLTTYEPLTITNSQPSATPNPFQQMVNFTSSDPGWASISTSNFGQNVEFFYYNGTVIPSWLENYTSSHALWWLKIAAIPAGSSETVYVGFAPTTTNLFNTVNDGEAPQLSSTYAEYDDGTYVFNFYDNFAGTALSSKWTSYSSGFSATINDGFTITLTANQLSGSNAYVITSTSTFPENSIIEAYAEGSVAVTNTRSYMPSFTTAAASTEGVDILDQTSYPNIAFSNGRNGVLTYADFQGSTSAQYYNDVSNPSGYNIQGIAYTGSTNIWYTNYKNVVLSSTDSPTGNVYAALGMGIYDGNPDAVSMSVQWVRVRAYPPNGVMPSISFNSVA